jgi:hypothetical protein
VLGDAAAKAEALARMRDHYARAVALATAADAPDLFYPLENLVAAKIVRGEPVDDDMLRLLRDSLAMNNARAPDFWSHSGAANATLYEALVPGPAGRLARALPRLFEAYEDLHARMAGTWAWSSVRDQVRFLFDMPGPGHALTGEDTQAAQHLCDRLEAYATGTHDPKRAPPEAGASSRSHKPEAGASSRSRKSEAGVSSRSHKPEAGASSRSRKR